MATTASKKSVKTPVYHLILSWKSVEEGEKVPPDDPTREEMEEAVDRVLETLGLEEHQAWMVAHKDTSTPHVHVMINRVHPETSRTWNPPFPKKETYPVLRELEVEKGWHQPAPEDPSQTWESPESLEGWEATQEEKGREEASVRRWAREASVPQLLNSAISWAQAERMLIGTEATFESRREQGMVLKRKGGHAALSSIHPRISRPNLELRYGQSWETHVRNREDDGPSERLSKKLPGRWSPTAEQARLYRWIEKIEALREARPRSLGDEEDRTEALDALERHRKGARMELIRALRKARGGTDRHEGMEEGSEDLVALKQVLGATRRNILYKATEALRSERGGATWTAGVELTEQQEMALQHARIVRVESAGQRGGSASARRATLRASLTRMTGEEVRELIELLKTEVGLAPGGHGETKDQETEGRAREAQVEREAIEEEWSKVRGRLASEKLSQKQREAIAEIYRLEERLKEKERLKERVKGEQTGTSPVGRKLREVLSKMSEAEVEQLREHLSGVEWEQRILESQREPAKRMRARAELRERLTQAAEDATDRIQQRLANGHLLDAGRTYRRADAQLSDLREQAPVRV